MARKARVISGAGLYGWIRDLPDKRDQNYRAPMAVTAALPPAVDLRAKCPPVYDQGQLSSCTGNAVCAAFAFDVLRQAAPANDAAKPPLTNDSASAFDPSRLFAYYNGRAREGSVLSDAGAQIRDVIKGVVKQGVCSETTWPYEAKNVTRLPSPKCYAEGLKHQVLQYQSVPQIIYQLKGCLAAGFPFAFGFTVYESFESQAVAASGVVPMPAAGERALGGHAVMAVVYSDGDCRFIVRNSWGEKWGKGGYCFMPYSYLLDEHLAADFWTLRVVEMAPEK